MTVFLVFVGLILLLLTGMPIFAALGLTATIILLIFATWASSSPEPMRRRGANRIFFDDFASRKVDALGGEEDV